MDVVVDHPIGLFFGIGEFMFFNEYTLVLSQYPKQQTHHMVQIKSSDKRE